MRLFKRRPASTQEARRSDDMADRMPREGESMVEWYAANATPDLPTAQSGRVFALMAEVDRGRARREAKAADPRSRDEQREQSKQDRDRFLRRCRPASVDEYSAWLRGHLAAGGTVTHPYDYPFPGGWYVLTDDPRSIPSLYGALSLNVIVPAWARLTPRGIPNTFHGGCGHSNFYFIDGFRQVGGRVPSFSDVRPASTN